MPDYVILAAFFAAYFGCGAGAFEDLSRRKVAWGQMALSARHGHWMTHRRRFDPVRALWVGSVVSLACALVTAQRLLFG